ncbi:Met-10+ like-protein-domain-containing protein [Lipomyces japonicus]|uniref:Met-10+ like-protein-domain-containing protein n=1 Tax=Lipomyces japonicus TaxID=56871 RepID=UPI0034CD8531
MRLPLSKLRFVHGGLNTHIITTPSCRPLLLQHARPLQQQGLRLQIASKIAQYSSNMSTELDNTTFTVPIVRGKISSSSSNELDRSLFDLHVRTAAIDLPDARLTPQILKTGIEDVLKVRSLSNISKFVDQNGVKKHLIILKPEFTENDFDKLKPELRELLQNNGIKNLVPYTINIGYNFWKTDDLLASILPEELHAEIPTGFSTTGHIAHMNIRPQYLPFKRIIGQIILDKNPSIRTVVNKLDSIDTVFRTFEMEVIAGEENFNVEQSESGCKFQFDFAKVYWNSRLGTEHGRLIDTFKPGEAVCDVFAGVGPFAVPAGKKNVFVLANDLNRHSFASLANNIDINNVTNRVIPYNIDGRQFIKSSISELKRYTEIRKQFTYNDPVKRVKNFKTGRSVPAKVTVTIPTLPHHYAMNLPATAIEFLDAFRGLFKGQAADAELPMVHVYCFHKADLDNPKPDDQTIHNALHERVCTALGFDIAFDELSVHFVRAVAPTKTMHCVSFRLPKEVAFANN